MNLFKSITTTSTVTEVTPSSQNLEQKIPDYTSSSLAEAQLQAKEFRSKMGALPYALSSEITAHVAAKGKRKKSGKNKVLHMPSPEQALRLNKTYNIVQTTNPTTITSSISVSVASAFSVQLSFFGNSTNLQTVFDQYRIALVEVSFLPRASLNTVTAVSDPGRFVSVVDLDDNTALSGISNALSYQGAKITEGTKEHKRTFVPHIAVAAYSGTFTSYANEAAPWIDCASNTVQHFGVKTYWTATTNVEVYDVFFRAHLQFRNVF